MYGLEKIAARMRIGMIARGARSYTAVPPLIPSNCAVM